MQQMIAAPAHRASRMSKFVLPAVLILVSLLGMLGFIIARSSQAAAASSLSAPISPALLAEKYGLQVNLIGVTAAGGMVDLRLKIVDAEKARLLLQGGSNFPALRVDSNGTILSVSDDTKAQEIKFENGAPIFLLFPNAHNSVKPGSAVTLLFGNIPLEPIISK
jgi:hypothetical protein